MKRIYSLPTLLVGITVGFLCGIALTAAYSQVAKYNYDQVVAKIGGTQITRSRLAEYAIAQSGDRLLSGDLQDLAIVEEAAQRAGITVSDAEVKQRVDETLQLVTGDAERKQLEATRGRLEAQLRGYILAEKVMNIKVTDADVDAFYARNKAAFLRPARAKLIVIVTNKLSDDVAIMQRLKAGEDPKKLSEIFSTVQKVKERRGDMGWATRDNMSPLMASKIFDAHNNAGMRPKEFTDAVPFENRDTGQTEYWYCYVEEIQQSKLPDLKEIRPMVTALTRTQKFQEMAPKWYQEQIRTMQWMQVKDLSNPNAQLEVVPIDPDKYRPKPTGGGNAG